MYLPGLVGSGVLWLRACREAETLYDAADWMTLEGESGVGKLALARAVHQRRNPAAPFHVIDAEGAGQDWLAKTRGELLEGVGMLVIRHADALNAKQVHALASALQEARTAKRHTELRVAVTLSRKQAGADLTRLLRFFQGTVELPPLRHHIEDLHELVPFFLARLSQQGRLTCSPEAMQLLLRHNWPGNTEQLWQVLKQVVQRRRAGVIMPRDLPPRVLDGEPQAAVPAGVDRAGRDRAEPAGPRRQQGPGGRGAGHVPRHHLPQDPRVRHRRLGQLDAPPGGPGSK